MLGSVARKLRIFGFDTLYIADADDAEILQMGIDLNRIILTADKELFKRAVNAGARGVLVDCGSDLEDLVHILSKNGIASIGDDWIGSRCSVCNGLLEERNPEQVRNKVPEMVGANHDEFFECVDCGKVYWEGSHLERIRTLARRIESRLVNGVV